MILRKNCTWILFGTRGADALYPLLVRKDPHLHPILILGYLCEDITRHAMGPTDTHHHSAFSAVPLGRLVQVLPSCLPTPSPFLLMLPRCDSAMLRRLAILASLLVINCLARYLRVVCRYLVVFESSSSGVKDGVVAVATRASFCCVGHFRALPSSA